MVAVALLMTWVATLHAAEPVPLVEPYPAARLDRHIDRMTDDYTLPLSAWRSVGGDWRLENSERVAGRLQRFTYAVTEGHTAKEAHDHWLNALRSLNATSLFSCRGRGCGPSNQWANAVFDNRELYGLDEHQRYDALDVEQAGQRYAIAIYSVERGNRRVYSHLDIVALEGDHSRRLPTTADGILVPLQERGQLVFTAAPAVDATQAEIEALALALKKDIGLRLYVVGHAYGNEPLAALRRRAQQYADNVVGALVGRGINAERIEGVGVGPLAPGDSGRRDRIELVRIKAD